MRIAPVAVQSPSAVPAVAADPIEWFFFEARGSQWGDDGGWPQLTIEAWSGAGGEAIVTDGRMSYPHDPGRTEDRYYSYYDFVRDGVDAGQAMEDARVGVAALVAALERGSAQTADEFRVPSGTRVPRTPDQLDIWIRRGSGARERLVVPVDRLPQGLRDASVNASAFAAAVRRDFVQFPGGELESTTTA